MTGAIAMETDGREVSLRRQNPGGDVSTAGFEAAQRADSVRLIALPTCRHLRESSGAQPVLWSDQSPWQAAGLCAADSEGPPHHLPLEGHQEGLALSNEMS
ncbi:hypothetical protein VTN02DRAFT_5369 [Thermoascus thermophilus]